MEKAGYLQRTGYKAFDSDGNVHDVDRTAYPFRPVCDPAF